MSHAHTHVVGVDGVLSGSPHASENQTNGALSMERVQPPKIFGPPKLDFLLICCKRCNFEKDFGVGSHPIHYVTPLFLVSVLYKEQ